MLFCLYSFRSPALIGCFIVDRQYFQEIGLLDEGMEVYGGENVELGIRVRTITHGKYSWLFIKYYLTYIRVEKADKMQWRQYLGELSFCMSLWQLVCPFNVLKQLAAATTMGCVWERMDKRQKLSYHFEKYRMGRIQNLIFLFFFYWMLIIAAFCCDEYWENSLLPLHLQVAVRRAVTQWSNGEGYPRFICLFKFSKSLLIELKCKAAMPSPFCLCLGVKIFIEYWVCIIAHFFLPSYTVHLFTIFQYSLWFVYLILSPFMNKYLPENAMLLNLADSLGLLLQVKDEFLDRKLVMKKNGAICVTK